MPVVGARERLEVFYDGQARLSYLRYLGSMSSIWNSDLGAWGRRLFGQFL